MTASNRWLVIVAVGIVLAVAAGVVVTMVAGGERRYAEGTPERTVQDYLRAVSERDATRALSYVAPSVTAQCTEIPRDVISNRGTSSIRAALDRSTLQADRTAEVRVRITESYGDGGPFGGGESSHSQVFLLAQDQGQWRFSEAPWPIYCPKIAPPFR